MVLLRCSKVAAIQQRCSLCNILGVVCSRLLLHSQTKNRFKSYIHSYILRVVETIYFLLRLSGETSMRKIILSIDRSNRNILEVYSMDATNSFLVEESPSFFDDDFDYTALCNFANTEFHQCHIRHWRKSPRHLPIGECLQEFRQ